MTTPDKTDDSTAMTWINCIKHDLLDNVDKCSDCHYELTLPQFKALIQAERIKARNEGAYFALREHEGVYTDQITKGEIYRKLVRQIDKELAELDTPKGGER